MYNDGAKGTMKKKQNTVQPEKHLKLNIQPLVEAKGLSISAFGRLAGFDYRTAYDLVKGKYKRIGLDTLEKLMKALECDIADLFIFE